MFSYFRDFVIKFYLSQARFALRRALTAPAALPAEWQGNLLVDIGSPIVYGFKRSACRFNQEEKVSCPAPARSR